MIIAVTGRTPTDSNCDSEQSPATQLKEELARHTSAGRYTETAVQTENKDPPAQAYTEAAVQRPNTEAAVPVPVPPMIDSGNKEQGGVSDSNYENEIMKGG